VWSVCPSVVYKREPCETAEPMKMSFVGCRKWGPKKQHVGEGFLTRRGILGVIGGLLRRPHTCQESTFSTIFARRHQRCGLYSNLSALIACIHKACGSLSVCVTQLANTIRVVCIMQRWNWVTFCDQVTLESSDPETQLTR